MNSLLLRTATRFVQPLLLMFSIFALVRGHNEPGGGFVGGLLAASAFALHAIAYDVAAARQVLRVDPLKLVGIGLCLAAGSGMLALLVQDPFMTGQWTELDVPGLGKVPLGTPVVFDVGVYLVVLGVAVTIVWSLAEEE